MKPPSAKTISAVMSELSRRRKQKKGAPRKISKCKKCGKLHSAREMRQCKGGAQ